MDMMEIRRRVMRMAGKSCFATGVYEPLEDAVEVTLNVGFPIKSIYFTVTDNQLVSGKRQMLSAAYVEDDGNVYLTSIFSNAYGTSIAGIIFYTENIGQNNPAVTVNGNEVTIHANSYNGGLLISGKAYKWFAFA